MILYITLGTNNLAVATRFYDAVMATLGVGRHTTNEIEVGYASQGESRCRLWVVTPYNARPATTANGAMPAFAARTRTEVDAFHAAGLANGGTDEGKPGPRPYGPDFYACYLRDPDGNKLSAVCENGSPQPLAGAG